MQMVRSSGLRGFSVVATDFGASRVVATGGNSSYRTFDLAEATEAPDDEKPWLAKQVCDFARLGRSLHTVRPAAMRFAIALTTALLPERTQMRRPSVPRMRSFPMLPALWLCEAGLAGDTTLHGPTFTRHQEQFCMSATCRRTGPMGGEDQVCTAGVPCVLGTFHGEAGSRSPESVHMQDSD